MRVRLGEDPGRLLVVGERRDEVEVGGDAADADIVAEVAADALLEQRPPAVGDVLRNPCSSGKPSVTTLPSTPIGRQAVISGFTARLRSVMVVTTEAQPWRSRSRSSPRLGPGSTARWVPAQAPAAAPGLRLVRTRGRAMPDPGRRGRGRRVRWRGRRRRAGVGLRRPGAARRRGSPGREPGRRLARAAVTRARAPRRARAAPRPAPRSRRGAGSSSASSSWSRRPPGPEPRRVDAREAARGGGDPRVGRRHWRRGRRAGAPAGRRRPGPGRRAGRGPAPRAGPAARCRPRRRRVASAATKPSTSSASARPRRSRTASASMRPAVDESSWSRIDSASRMPPAASRAMIATASGSASRPSGRRIRSSLPVISGHGEPRGRRSAGGATGSAGGKSCGCVDANMKVTKSGRLLERLEQRVPGVLGDLVRLVEDVDLAPQVGRRVVEALPELAHVVDAAVGRGVDLDAGPGRGPRGSRRTTRRRRTGPRCGRRFLQLSALARMRASDVLPVPRGPVNRMACATCSGRHGVAERGDHRLLADDLGERLGPPAAVEGLVGCRCGQRRSCGGRGEVKCRAPSVDTDAPAPTGERGSDQAVPRHPTIIAECCFLPDLTRFASRRCAGPGPQRRERRRLSRTPTSGGNSALLERIAGTGHR